MPRRYGFRIVWPQINMPAAMTKKNTPNQRRRTSAGLAGIAGSYHVAMAFPSGKIAPAPIRAHVDAAIGASASGTAPAHEPEPETPGLPTKTFCSQTAF